MDGVGISIIERPRPLHNHDTPNPTHHTYTLKCEEPEKFKQPLTRRNYLQPQWEYETRDVEVLDSSRSPYSLAEAVKRLSQWLNIVCAEQLSGTCNETRGRLFVNYDQVVASARDCNVK